MLPDKHYLHWTHHRLPQPYQVRSLRFFGGEQCKTNNRHGFDVCIYSVMLILWMQISETKALINSGSRHGRKQIALDKRVELGKYLNKYRVFFYYMAIMYLDEEIQFVPKIFCLGIDRWILSAGWLKTVVCQLDKFLVSGKYAHAGVSRWELMICLVPKLLITVISHERHGVSNHRQLDSSPSNLFRLTSKETKLRITTLWQECIGCRDSKLVTCRRVCTPVVFFNRPWYGVNYDICTY